MTNLLRSILSAYKRTVAVIYFIYGVTVLTYFWLRYGENMVKRIVSSNLGAYQVHGGRQMRLGITPAKHRMTQSTKSLRSPKSVGIVCITSC